MGQATFKGYFISYKANDWNSPLGYLNRAWCRIEMMDCAMVPLRAESVLEERLKCFKVGLLHALKNGRRSHVLYGAMESRMNSQPIGLPPLLHSNFEMFNPEKGALSNEADRLKIRELVKDLESYKKEVVYGYVGKVKLNNSIYYVYCIHSLLPFSSYSPT
jgi:hypothetical protein